MPFYLGVLGLEAGLPFVYTTHDIYSLANLPTWVQQVFFLSLILKTRTHASTSTVRLLKRTMVFGVPMKIH